MNTATADKKAKKVLKAGAQQKVWTRFYEDGELVGDGIVTVQEAFDKVGSSKSKKSYCIMRDEMDEKYIGRFSLFLGKEVCFSL